MNESIYERREGTEGNKTSNKFVYTILVICWVDSLHQAKASWNNGPKDGPKDGPTSESQNHGTQAILVLSSFCLTPNRILMDKSTHVIFRCKIYTDKKRSHNSYQKAKTVKTSRACDIVVLTSNSISMGNMQVKYTSQDKKPDQNIVETKKKNY